MSAGKAADAYGGLQGHATEQCDAEQAYIQSKLGGDPTWVRLPRERWPASWSKMKDPVCPLILALYGHPDSGGYWKAHCERHLRECGFEPIPNWRSCFYQPKTRMFLVVYVDDFKLAGPTEHMAQTWVDIRKAIKTEDPTPSGKYLGCDHVITKARFKAAGNPRVPNEEASNDFKPYNVTTVTYDMRNFLESCVEHYRELARVTARPSNHARLHSSTATSLTICCCRKEILSITAGLCSPLPVKS
jgi:hypothetical protein